MLLRVIINVIVCNY